MDIQAHLRTISEDYCLDEQAALAQLITHVSIDAADIPAITARASRWIAALGGEPPDSLVQQVLQEFSLHSEEGKALMALSEALLRIPDRAVAEALISDKLTRGEWRHQGEGDHPLFVQVSAMLLGLSGHLLATGSGGVKHPLVGKLLKSFSAPVVHRVLVQMIRLMAGQFVFANDIDTAMKRATAVKDDQQRYSFDMLGEASVCQRQAEEFFDAYYQAIERASAGHNISIKLSALTPHFDVRKRERTVPELVDKLDPLLALAVQRDVGITIDAEEADKLDITLATFAALYSRWGHSLPARFGLAVQAYSKRAPAVLRFLKDLAADLGPPVAVRLVKGAYWDTEVKLAQVAGLADYPVFTEKVHTDLSWLACAHYLMAHPQQFYAQFATHNPVSISHVLQIANGDSRFEFQRLYGMGASLYEAVLQHDAALSCRVYCPVGHYRQLLPYLVRRILENGANSSIVRQLAAADAEPGALAKHPLESIQQDEYRHFRLPVPGRLFGESRDNSSTVNLANRVECDTLLAGVQAWRQKNWLLLPVLAAETNGGLLNTISNPADGSLVGQCQFADAALMQAALADAANAFPRWSGASAGQRAQLLEAFAGLLQEHREELVALLVLEAGKTISDGIDELREAVDFARYYAGQARQLFADWQHLDGPVGEHNSLGASGRGVFLCISPWNFPLAIFVGQVTAALAAGNCVLAKPAEETPLVACRAVQLMHTAGLARDVIQCLPGPGPELAAAVVADARLAGVAFTGSTLTARHINRALADREGPIVPFIAETGGQNAMIVDSSALPEQVVMDVIHSAFFSAGQRCSALRVLFVQEDIRASLLQLLIGAMQCLQLGDPAELATDIGPVISREAVDRLRTYIDTMRAQGKLLHAVTLPSQLDPYRFVAPHLFSIDSMDELAEEHFGPILHVLGYAFGELDDVVEQIHRSQYGLTVGIQSRNQAFCEQLADKLRVGNVYINRSMTGAVVGVQPFGGMGLSGTGPKAGGPHYLQRFAVEKTISNNVAAIGGNVSLLVD